MPASRNAIEDSDYGKRKTAEIVTSAMISFNEIDQQTDASAIRGLKLLSDRDYRLSARE
jgi:ribosomal 30S subunit maturation factor RimM